MHKTVLTFIIAIAAVVTLPCPAQADAFDDMYNEYIRLFNLKDKRQEFYDMSERVKDYYLDHDNLYDYYQICANEAIYESDHNNPHLAIRKSIEIFNEMKDKGYNGLNLVYLSLGNIYESCGSQRVAEHYYQEAIDHTNDHDDRLAMDAFSRMANLLKIHDPARAKEWNAKYAYISNKYPAYHQVYLLVNAVIAFAENNREEFIIARDSFTTYANLHPDLQNYGEKTIHIIDNFYDGNTEEALKQLDEGDSELGEIATHEMRILIYQTLGMDHEALLAAKRRALCVDSLNASLQLHNIHEMATEAALAKARSDADSEQMRMLTIVLVLSFLLIVTLAVYNYRRKKDREEMAERNEQLKTALSMAEESDKMKMEFVRSVSHEIRTPLNAITGFSEIIVTPGMDLTEEEQQDLVSRIHHNVKAITDIVDEMLRTAERGSTDYYPKSNSILCNQFFSQLLYSYRDKVSSSIELRYTTNVINRFSIQSNENGLSQILNHLIDNAIKFTESGFIELNCQQNEKNELVVSLSDTGRGIPKDQQDKIFEQFYKGDSFQQGIGLGLTVSKKIAQKLGGDLVLDPTYTGGSKFVLTLSIE